MTNYNYRVTDGELRDELEGKMRDLTTRRYEQVPDGWKCRLCDRVVKDCSKHTAVHDDDEVRAVEGFMEKILPSTDFGETGD